MACEFEPFCGSGISCDSVEVTMYVEGLGPFPGLPFFSRSEHIFRIQRKKRLVYIEQL